jgi:hypothetical protein
MKMQISNYRFQISDFKSQISYLKSQISTFKSPLLLASLLLAGCSSNQSSQTSQETFFQSPDEVPLATRMFDTQAARGARADATLYPQHFDGARLNSLGKSKIDLMLRDTEAGPLLKLYIDGQSSDPAWTARADGVKQHLASSGLIDTQYEVVAGPNPATWHPVAKDIEAMGKPEVAKPAADAASFTPTSPTPSTGK